jgi:lycopene cyclase domain-containing protein
LLAYADAFRDAARTVAVVYPLGFIWDWYTLTVGVFAIRKQIGIHVLGIPIEEHIFIMVVPAMVVGVHESLNKVRDRKQAD